MAGVAMSGAICGGYDADFRRVQFCPTEQRRRRLYCTFAGWYGVTWYCLGCGDCWQDGERGSRPFERGWRAKAIARAKSGWRAAMSPREAHRAIRATICASVG
jgi:hypothetical protein